MSNNQFNDMLFNTTDTTDQYDPADISANKTMALLAYIGVLFLVPLLGVPNSRFARFHATQGITLFVLGIVASLFMTVSGLILGLLGRVFFLFSIISILLNLAIALILLAFIIIGIKNAVDGKAKELPFIGRFQLLK